MGRSNKTRNRLLPTLLGLTGAVFGSLLGFYGSQRAAESRNEFLRLSTAYAGYVSSLAQTVSASDLHGMIEARANVMLYGDRKVLAKLAAGRLPCEGDWFLNVIEDLRPRIGRDPFDRETARDVLCGPKPLRATFAGIPEAHHGKFFTFEVHFSEPLPLSYVKLRDEGAFRLANARIVEAKRIAPPSNQHWTITVLPTQVEDVTISLSKDRACDEPGAVCTVLGKRLSNSPWATVCATSCRTGSVHDAAPATGASHRPAAESPAAPDNGRRVNLAPGVPRYEEHRSS